MCFIQLETKTNELFPGHVSSIYHDGLVRQKIDGLEICLLKYFEFKSRTISIIDFQTRSNPLTYQKAKQDLVKRSFSCSLVVSRLIVHIIFSRFIYPIIFEIFVCCV